MNPSPPKQRKLPGVIDTLGTGFATLNRHAYLLIVPVVLDLVYWLGPRLSFQSLARSLSELIDEAVTSPAVTAPGTQTAQSAAVLKSMVEQIGQNANMLTLLSLPLGIPTLSGSQDLTQPSRFGAMPVWDIPTWSDFFALVGLIFLIGVLVGAVCMGAAAQVVRDGRLQPALLARRVGLYAARFLAFVVMILGLSVLAGVPIALMIGLATLLSPAFGGLLLLLFWIGMLWLYFYLFFVTDALFVGEVGPLRAIAGSATVVRMSVSTALSLMVVVIVVSLGMSYVWSALGTSEVAVLAGIVGNAYIGSGLTLATMTFYRDRMAALR